MKQFLLLVPQFYFSWGPIWLLLLIAFLTPPSPTRAGDQVGCLAQYLLNDCKVRNPGTSLLQKLFRFVCLSPGTKLRRFFSNLLNQMESKSSLRSQISVRSFSMYSGVVFFYFQGFYLPAAKAFFFLVLSLLNGWAHLIVTH